MPSDKEQREGGRDRQNGEQDSSPARSPGSTMSLGKRRHLKAKSKSKGKSRMGQRASGQSQPQNQQQDQQQQQQPQQQNQNQNQNMQQASPEASHSTMSNPKASDYGSQASPMRIPTTDQLTKVAILGAGGGIGQPLAMLLMLHSEYVQHVALYDLVHVRGVAADLAHIDHQCRITSHLGPDELADAVRGAKVIVIPAGLAQKPGMSRDDLFGSNAKIALNLAKVCAQHAPQAHIALISNPVNSLVPLFCETYLRILHPEANATANKQAQQQQQQPQDEQPKQQRANPSEPLKISSFQECCRRIFGVTTLDVVRASTLTARSALFKPEQNGLFKDPAKISMPVVGGHAGKTIIPLLSQANPRLDKRRLAEDRTTVMALVDSIQQAGIEVLNAKKGAGSATLAMAYAACRFTIALLRAQLGEQNIIECAYVRHQQPIVSDLEYFATPLVLGKNGYVKSLGLGKLLPYEQQMVDDAIKELKTSIAKGEDFAREHCN